MNKNTHSYIKLCLYVISFCIAVDYLLISVNNRYQNDDFGFNNIIALKNGVVGAFEYFFYQWECNINSIVLLFLIQFIDTLQPWVYNVSIFLLNAVTLNFLLRKIRFDFFDRKMTFLYSVLIIGLWYFSCRGQGNVVYWVTGQIAYALPVCYLFLGLGLWIEKKFFSASILLFLFAHSRINYDAIFLAVLLLFFVLRKFNKKRVLFTPLGFLPLFAFLFGVITYVMIPGIRGRMAAESTSNTEIFSVDSILMFIAGVKYYIFSLFDLKYFLVLITGVFVGVENDLLRNYLTKRAVCIAIVIFGVIYCANSICVFLAIRTFTGYGRIFFLLDLILVVLFLLLGVFISRIFVDKFTNWIAVRVTMLLFCFLGYRVYTNFLTTRFFAESYDSRISVLLQEKSLGRERDLFLRELPASGPLSFMEIFPRDTLSRNIKYDNAVYREYYKLKFNIFTNRSVSGHP